MEVTKHDSVLGDEALHAAGAILDAERGAVGNIRRRLGVVVLVVDLAGNVCSGALLFAIAKAKETGNKRMHVRKGERSQFRTQRGNKTDDHQTFNRTPKYITYG